MKKETTMLTINRGQRTIRTAFMLSAISLGCLCGLPLAVAGGDAGKAGTADVKGITLGMTPEQAQTVLPGLSLGRNDSGGYYGGLGKGWGARTNWFVIYKIADEPYGAGVDYVIYSKAYIDIDRRDMAKNIRQQLAAKYGEPTCEDAATNGTYHAYWGQKCDMTNYISSITRCSYTGYDELSWANRDMRIPDGPYIVAVCDAMPWDGDADLVLKVIMFDLTPYRAKMKEEQRQEQEKIKSNSQQGTGL